MVEIFGKEYYIDIDGITDKCRTGRTIKTDDEEDSLEVNIFKYEIIKMCLDRILPLSYFEKAKDGSGSMPQISINITSLGEPKIEQAEIIDNVDITDVNFKDE